MATVGQLTAGVAHDFANMLQAVLGGLEVLRAQGGLDMEGRNCLAVTEQAARRAATLARRLLAFSRDEALEPELLTPASVLAGVSALLGRMLGGRVRAEYHAEEGAWPVRADAAQLDNCLLNLALNARDAMPGGGVVRLYAGNAAGVDFADMGLPDGEYVCFRVEDEGTGMPQATLKRALEPFFTTKPAGEGAGLGLAMVQGFARQSGGDVRIESVVGRGTKVILWLPRARSEDVPARAKVLPDQPGQGGGKILIVDDEAVVGRMLSMVLAKGGFRPMAVASGETALGLLRDGAVFDLLVTDESMPGLTGCDLIDEVARLRPAMPAILITGYDGVSARGEQEARVTVLRKPFEGGELVRWVRESLAGRALASCGAGAAAGMDG